MGALAQLAELAERAGEGARILLIRTSALGDVVHGLPVLSALRRGLPRARIAWVVEEAFAPLLLGHELLDVVIPVRLRHWRRRPLAGTTRSELATAMRDLRAFRPTVAIDLMGTHKGATLARLSGARIRLGAERAERREASSAIWLTDLVSIPSQHAIERGIDLLRPFQLGHAPIDLGGGELAGTPPPDASAGSRFVFLHPGAAWGNKRYPPELWGAVARSLAQHDLEVRVAVSPGEEALAETIVSASDRIARPAPAHDLPSLVGWLRASAVVAAGDTGPMHLARALGRPVVAVMGPTNPRRHGPYGQPSRVVARRLVCSYCHRRFAESKACLTGISPAEIAAAVVDLARASV